MTEKSVINAGEAGIMEGPDLVILADKMKTVMLKRKVDRAQKTCPRCQVKGALKARLAGPRKHIHINCITPDCGVQIME